jgi:rfaE bifunctional protein kinase chain/domain
MIKNSSILVFGKFRVVHPGHMRLFKQALDLGSKLVVGIISNDENNQDVEFSKTLLRNLPFIDEVIVEREVETLIRKVQPNIILVGAEHKDSEISRLAAVREVGARIVYSSGETFLNTQDLVVNDNSSSIVLKNYPIDFLKRNNINFVRLKNILAKFQSLKVVVVGDLIIDEYINCHTIGMSNEDPMVVNAPISSTKYIGGAGIVAAHCSALGASAHLVSIVGDDETSNWALRRLKELGVASKIQRDSTRDTTLKQRYKNGHHTLFRLSKISRNPIDNNLHKIFQREILELIESADVLIFSDFSYGVLTNEVSQHIIKSTQIDRLFVSADSQSSSQVGNLGKFSGVDLVCATEREARLELRNDSDGLAYIANQLRKKLNSKNVFLKLGSDGVLLDGIAKNLALEINTDRVPALNPNPLDVSGAGDSMLAISSLCFASGADIYESALISSLGSAIQVGRQGNIPVTLDEITFQLSKMFD